MVKIKSAAIKYFNLNLNIWQIVTGKTHAECFKKMYEQDIKYDKSRYEQGFVTSQGNEHFVSRTVAGYIAWKAGQINEIPRKPKMWYLYSENIDWSV